MEEEKESVPFSLEEKTLTDLSINDIILDSVDLKKIVHYYSVSAIPFAMGLCDKRESEDRIEKDGHSVVCIGCGEPSFELSKVANPLKMEGITFVDASEFFNSYVIMDDNQIPYCVEKYDCFSNNQLKVDIISVPLYKHVFLDAPNAVGIVYHYLAQYSKEIRQLYEEYEEVNHYLETEPMITNLFLTSSSTFQSNRMESTDSEQEKLLYLEQQYPRYVWVCELSPFSLFKEGYVTGEIVLDATSDVNDLVESIISIRFGKYVAYHGGKNKKWTEEFITNDSWDYKYKSFDGNLKRINKEGRLQEQ